MGPTAERIVAGGDAAELSGQKNRESGPEIGQIDSVRKFFRDGGLAVSGRSEDQTLFRRVFNDAPVAILTATLDGTITMANPAADRLIACPPGTLVGRSYVIFVNDEDKSDSLARLRDLATGSLDDYCVIIRLNRLNGEPIWVRASVSFVPESERSEAYFVWICADITELRGREDELRAAHAEMEQRVEERTAELGEANRRLEQEVAMRKRTQEAILEEQRSLRAMLDAQDRERQLVAYEIHDGLTQQIIAAKMALEAHRASGENEHSDSLSRALQMLSNALREARHLISGLRPPALDEAGLCVALQHLAVDNQERGVEVELTVGDGLPRLPRTLENTIFRIVQEALSNVCRHSEADRAAVSVQLSESGVSVTVSDEGKGFDPEGVNHRSYGLRGIRDRARLLGGTAEITSAAGSGTTIQVHMPVESWMRGS